MLRPSQISNSSTTICNNDKSNRDKGCRSEETSTVEVVSPANLSEGYEFWVNLRNESFPVRVPPGGVKYGQKFLASLPKEFSCTPCCGCNNTITPKGTSFSSDDHYYCHDSHHHLPEKGRGQWKDGIFSCFRHGICHPHVWNAWLCPQLLMGQILARMNLKTWPFVENDSTYQYCSMNHNNKKQKNNNNNNNHMRKLIFVLIAISIYDAWSAPPLIEFTVDENGQIVIATDHVQTSSSSTTTEGGISSSSTTTITSSNSALWHQLFYLLLSLPMTIYGIFVVVKLRAAVRAKYGIPTGRLGRWEDFLYVFFCNCCILSQMARQTADYDDEPASCCSPNGMKSSSSSSSTTTTTKITTTIRRHSDSSSCSSTDSSSIGNSTDLFDMVPSNATPPTSPIASTNASIV